MGGCVCELLEGDHPVTEAWCSLKDQHGPTFLWAQPHAGRAAGVQCIVDCVEVRSGGSGGPIPCFQNCL